MKKEEKYNKHVINFNEGNLKGLSLFLTEEYKQMIFPHDNTDPQMISDIESNGPQGKKIFDIGAFIGSSSLLFSKLVSGNGKVIAFEPNPYNRSRFKKNLSLNKDLAKNISLFPYALADEIGTKVFTLSEEIDNGYSSTSRLNQSHPTLHNDQLPDGFKEISVEVLTLDQFVRDSKIIPDIIKIDIEGAEYDCLVGSRKTISKYKPIFYIEIHSEYCGVRCTELLNAAGYSIMILNEEVDNRIMIKAIPNGKTIKISSEEYLLRSEKNLDASIRTYNLIEKHLEQMNKDFNELSSKTQTLQLAIESIEKKGLEVENEILKKMNRNLEQGINAYEQSNSWKVTKPLRLLRKKLKL